MTDPRSRVLHAQHGYGHLLGIPIYRAAAHEWLRGVTTAQICALLEITPKQLQWSIDEARHEDRTNAEKETAA